MIVLEQVSHDEGLNGRLFKKISLKKIAQVGAIGLPDKRVRKKLGLNGYDEGYDEGLQGLKIGKFINRNLKSAKRDISIKNAVKVVKTVAPMVMSVVPVVGGVAGSVVGKVLNKVKTNKNGTANLIGRAISGQNGDGTANLVGRANQLYNDVSGTTLAQSAVKLVAPLAKTAKASLLEQAGLLPNDAQLQALADAKGTTAQAELDAIVEATPATTTATTTKAATTATTTTAKSDYTIPLLAAAGVGIAIFALK